MNGKVLQHLKLSTLMHSFCSSRNSRPTTATLKMCCVPRNIFSLHSCSRTSHGCHTTRGWTPFTSGGAGRWCCCGALFPTCMPPGWPLSSPTHPNACWSLSSGGVRESFRTSRITLMSEYPPTLRATHRTLCKPMCSNLCLASDVCALLRPVLRWPSPLEREDECVWCVRAKLYP